MGIGRWRRGKFNPDGPVEAKIVEEVFVRTAAVLDLRIGGRTITTTGEHPFYAEGQGWVPAEKLRPGDRVLGLDGDWLTVEEVNGDGRFTTVYNFRIADWHTYFVGHELWAFCIWVHNGNPGNCSSAPLRTPNPNAARPVVNTSLPNRVTQALSRRADSHPCGSSPSTELL